MPSRSSSHSAAKSKGERTREQVIEHAAALFNQLGYANASIADVMQATGLQKGGIYRHFESKQALALEAFDFAIRSLGERFDQALEGKQHAADKLQALVSVYARLPSDPPVPGGCPLLNAAVESDDSDPVLRKRVQKVMRDWQSFVRRIISAGTKCGELRRSLDADEFATTLIAALEGGIMMSKLLGSDAPMQRVCRRLTQAIAEARVG